MNDIILLNNQWVYVTKLYELWKPQLVKINKYL